MAILLPVQLLSVVRDPWFRQPPKPTGDGLEYENIGYHLWRDGEFAVRNKDREWVALYQSQADVYATHLAAPARDMLTTGRPPLYPAMIALMYSLFGRNELAFGTLRLASGLWLAVAGSISAWLTARVLTRCWERCQPPGWKLTVAAGVAMTISLAAAQRTLKSYAHDFLTEPMALLLMQAFVVLAIESQLRTGPTRESARGESPILRWSPIGCGVIFAGLILTRSIFVVWLPGIWLLWLLASPRCNWSAFRNAALVLVATILCCLPWWTRNSLVLEKPMPLGTQGPITLVGAYSDEGLQAGGDWHAVPEQRLRASLRNAPGHDLGNDVQREVAVAMAAQSQVRSWIRSHWTDLPQLFVSRIAIHWNPYWGLSLVWKLLAIAGVLTLLTYNKKEVSDHHGLRPARYWLIGLPLVSTLVAAGLYTTGGRFLVPMYGVLFSLGGIGIAGLLNWLVRVVLVSTPSVSDSKKQNAAAEPPQR